MALGKFIVFEGLDGSGQTTQVNLLAEKLKEKGLQVYSTKEPTNNILGGIVRSQLTKDWNASQTCLQLLFAADRAHHLEKEIIPALQKGWIVISDRYFFSSIAFGGVDIDMGWLKSVNSPFLIPDATFFIDVPPEICIERIKSSRLSLELFEELSKLKEVRKGYDKILNEFSGVFVVDGTKNIKELSEDIFGVVNKELKLDQLAKNMKWFLHH